MRLRDLTGQTFGRLTVVSRASTVRRRTRWNVRCSCSAVLVVGGKDLTRGLTRSCGCYQRESASRKIREYNSSPEGAASRRRASSAGAAVVRLPDAGLLNREYATHVRQGQARGFGSLERDAWAALVVEPCHYCGDIDTRITTYARKTGRTDAAMRVNGVDRIDSSIGYTTENSVPCCGRCNVAKMAMSGSDFIAMARQIAARHGPQG